MEISFPEMEISFTEIFLYFYEGRCFTPENRDLLGIALVSLLISIFICLGISEIQVIRRLPPGPWGIPWLGCLPWMCSGAPHSWYVKMMAKYGDIISLKLGRNRVICVGSAKILRDVFNRPDSIDRPATPLNKLLCGRGIVLSEGILWKKQRQFLQEKFRALGVRLWKNQRFEHYIIMEIEELMQQLEATNRAVVDPANMLGRHMHNVVCQLMMSFRFKEDDNDFRQFNEKVSIGMKLYGAIHIAEHLPFLLRLPGKQVVMEKIKQNLKEVSQFHVDRVKERRLERSMTLRQKEPADLLDYYLDQVDKEQDIHDALKIFPNVDPEKQMVQVMNDLFSAGMETSKTAIAWAMVFMVREPKVAGKVRRELAKVVHPGYLVTLEHHSKLPYTEATIFEILRRASVVPLGTTHVNTNNWNVLNYKIPKGSHIIPLINKINMDPEFFPEPEKFKPERFIKNGSVFTPEHFLPFGVGRRVCLGEQLARMELFLFFANLMNYFTFKLPRGREMPSLEGQLGMTHAPHPYQLIFEKRF